MLQALIHENHGHLVALGVSHPALEAIKSKTAADPYRLSTKLTGAGGGGCAVTLVPDGAYGEPFIHRRPIHFITPPDFKAQALQDLINDLIREDFQPYLTSVGGSGLGVLSGHHRNRRSAAYRTGHALGQVTPPETPIADDLSRPDAYDVEPLRPSFEASSISELEAWADGAGHWLYV